MNISTAAGIGAAAFARPERTMMPVELEKTSQVEPEEVVEETPLKKPGALRLLQAGHFKGVAELRHRIRFHEQLAAEANDKAAQTMAEGVDDLIGSVSEGVDSLVAAMAEDQAGSIEGDQDGGTEATDGEATPAIQSMLDVFTTAVDDAVNVDGVSSVDFDAVSSDLQSSFDALVSSLRELYEGPVVELVDEDHQLMGLPVELNKTETEPSPLDESIALLTASFEAALAALLADAEDASLLPDPKPAPGNGVAFDKFLAIYDDLRGAVSSTIDETA